MCVSMATGGPLSLSKEIAQLYSLEGVKEVSVRKVNKEEVGIDLLELKFKVQSILSGFCPHWSGVVGSNHHSAILATAQAYFALTEYNKG